MVYEYIFDQGPRHVPMPHQIHFFHRLGAKHECIFVYGKHKIEELDCIFIFDNILAAHLIWRRYCAFCICSSVPVMVIMRSLDPGRASSITIWALDCRRISEIREPPLPIIAPASWKLKKFKYQLCLIINYRKQSGKKRYCQKFEKVTWYCRSWNFHNHI